MGKTTGFMDYVRREDPVRDPLERTEDFEEFHGQLPPEKRQEQGGRCMNCGVPFCQSGMELEGKVYGCPLHNLIPEWNDMIWQSNGGHALSRLLKPTAFPSSPGGSVPPCARRPASAASTASR